MDDSVSYYAKEYGVFLPDGANSWFESRNGTINTTETTIVNKIGIELLPIVSTFLDWVIANMPMIQSVFSAVIVYSPLQMSIVR